MKKLFIVLTLVAFSYNTNAWFGPDTQISTPQGYVPLSKLSTGDIVYAVDHDGSCVLSTITHTHTKVVNSCCAIKTSKCTLLTTTDQKILTPSGWSTINSLKLNSIIYDAHSAAHQIKAIEYIHTQQTLYDITVANHHTFLATHDNLVVHNF